MTNPIDCRKFTRINIRLYLTHIKSDLIGEKLNGTSKDLSSGGIMFTSSVKYNVGDAVNLEINLPGWKEFKPKSKGLDITGKEEIMAVSAKVLRVQEVDKGMNFIGAIFIWEDNEHQKALEKYINNQGKGRKSFFS